MMSDSYSLHTADATTLPAVAALVGRVHGPGAEALTLNLARHFPEPVVVLWLRHDPSGAVASTLSLIPWRWRLGDTELPVWETGIVATAEDHRGQGLGTRLMEEAAARRHRAQVPVSIIQGIPFFYRRYGYEFAVPLETHGEWELRRLPGPLEGWTSRPAGPEDLPHLASWFQDRGHGVGSIRSEAHWHYRLAHAQGTETETAFHVLVSPEGQPAGAVGIAAQGFGEGLIVNEAGGGDQVWGPLAAWLKQEAVRRSRPFVRLHLGTRHPFFLWAQVRGARFTGSWHWQLKFDDPQSVLDLLSPEWARRWPDSLPSRLILDLFGGRSLVLARPGAGEGAEEARLCVPPELLPPLVLGWKPLAVLRETRPDLFGSEEALALAEALFPHRTAFCGSPY